MTNIVLKSSSIFTGSSRNLLNGYIKIENNKITYVGNNQPEIESDTKIIDLKDQMVLPGFVDSHCFFTGYLLTIFPFDCSSYKTKEQVFDYIKNSSDDVVLMNHLKLDDISDEDLNEFKDKSVIIFHEGQETCILNDNAKQRFEFDNSKCYSEGYWKLLEYILNKDDIAEKEFIKYLAMLNSKGITSIKEMGFDNYYNFTDKLNKLKNENKLTARVNFMSQPVGYDMDVDYGLKMKEKYNDEYLCFSGYNQMTDGSISQLEGYLKQPYLCEDTICKKDIDWDKLEADTLKADSLDMRFSLHAQGDGAIKKCLDIFNKCKKDSNGKLINRHAITDLECSDANDFKLMGELGVVAEIYPQIMSIAKREEKIAMINKNIGVERGKNYWNRRSMLDNDVVISCATDLPLLVDDIPESIYNSVYGLFPDSSVPFNKQNTISVSELLKAWTYGGQYNLGKESILGTIEVGKLADITVLNKNVLDVPEYHLDDVEVTLTIFDGKIVFKR